MADAEYGPFQTEPEALATRSAALIKAAFDDHPGYGASVPECLKVMTDACEASGVALGKLDLSFLQGVAWRETSDCISLAGMIRRAYEAGKATRSGATEVEWGVCTPQSDTGVIPYRDETAARHVGEPGGFEVMCREVGPWRKAHDGTA